MASSRWRLFAALAVVTCLAGCNGSLQIKEISPKRIALVDMLPRESFQATQRCLTLDIFHVDPVGDDGGISARLVTDVAARLEKEGYGVDIVAPSEKFDRKTFPGKYMVTPWLMYNTEWHPALTSWLHDVGVAHNVGAVVFLTGYVVSLYGNAGPYYGGYGVQASVNCIGIPPTRVTFYANTGVNVFTLPDLKRKYFSTGGANYCNVDVPDAMEVKVKEGVLGPADLQPYVGDIQRIALVQIERELGGANVLHGATDSCPTLH
jgi:hypothetical protein